MRKLIKWGAALLIGLGLCQSSFAANIMVWGNQGSQAAIVEFLTQSGHTVTDNGNVAPTTAQLAGFNIAIVLRSDGNTDVVDWVASGGCLITEWTGAGWAVDGASLLDASVATYGQIGTGTPVTITADGISAGLAAGISNPYTAGPASEFFHTFTGIGSGVSVMATRPGDIPAILGGQYGSGLVLANGIDWGDLFSSTGADNHQLLLNSVQNFCSGTVVPPYEALPVPALSIVNLAILAGLMGAFGLYGFRRFRKN